MKAIDLEPIKDSHKEMLELLIDWSNINSYSYNLTGLATMLEKIKAEFLKLKLELDIEEIDLQPSTEIDSNGNEIERPLAKALRITKKSNNPNAKKILLMGHMDTVFPEDSDFQTCKEIKDGILNGPGTADLKGGLVVMLKALETFENSEHADKIAWQVFLNPDEEIGSPGSQKFFPELSKRNDLGLIYEPSLSDGSIAFQRKGTGNFNLVIRGKAAHVGREFDKGASAILYAAKFIEEANKLNSEDIIVNFGKIQGGGPLNVVPDLTILGINVRISSSEHAELVENSFNKIIAKLNQSENIEMKLHGKFNRKPKIPDQKTTELYELIEECVKELGQKVSKRNTGGCCDGNNLFEHGLANIDTLGVRGGNIHSSDEFVNLESLVERSQLSTLLLCKIAQKGLKEGSKEAL